MKRISCSVSPIVIALALWGCKGMTESCTVVDNDDGSYTLTCDDGTEVTFSDGEDCADGSSCTVSPVTGGVLISCDDGTLATVLDGSGCTVVDNGCTATLSCTDGTSVDFSTGDCVMVDLTTSTPTGCTHDTVVHTSTEFSTTEASSGGQCSFSMDFDDVARRSCNTLEFDWAFDNPSGSGGSWLQIMAIDETCAPFPCSDGFTALGAASGSGTESIDISTFNSLRIHIEFVHAGNGSLTSYSLSNVKLTDCI